MQETCFPHLAAIAFAMLGQRTSSADLECDFCPHFEIMNRGRGSLDPATVGVQ